MNGGNAFDIKIAVMLFKSGYRLKIIWGKSHYKLRKDGCIWEYNGKTWHKYGFLHVYFILNHFALFTFIKPKKGEQFMKLLYIDIDGVLLGKKNPNEAEIVAAKHHQKFLKYCISNFNCYWLSTHSKSGSIIPVLNYLKSYFDKKDMDLIKQISAISWDTLKTEAIALESNFYVIDDQMLYSDIQVLKKYDVFDRWIQINTRKNPNDLLNAIKILKTLA